MIEAHYTRSCRFVPVRRVLVVGHIIPAERYPGHHDDPANLRTMCVSCKQQPARPDRHRSGRRPSPLELPLLPRPRWSSGTTAVASGRRCRVARGRWRSSTTTPAGRDCPQLSCDDHDHGPGLRDRELRLNPLACAIRQVDQQVRGLLEPHADQRTLFAGVRRAVGRCASDTVFRWTRKLARNSRISRPESDLRGIRRASAAAPPGL